MRDTTLESCNQDRAQLAHRSFHLKNCFSKAFFSSPQFFFFLITRHLFWQRRDLQGLLHYGFISVPDGFDIITPKNRGEVFLFPD